MLSDSIERKFIESFQIDDWEIESDTGWVDITHLHKTVEYTVFRLELENGLILECADDHIVFDADYNQIFVKDLTQSDSIITDSGPIQVKSVTSLDYAENMFDLTVDSANHRYYTNSILSHNTTVSAAYILWFSITHTDKTSVILGNKASLAREILDRIKLMYEYLPIWLKPGIEEWNKGRVKFDNKSQIITGATSASAGRGLSIALLYLDELSFVQRGIVEEFWTSTYPTVSSGKESKIIISTTPNGYDFFYKLWTESEQGINEFRRIKFDYHDHPDRDEKWQQTQIKNLGIDKFNQEFGAEFLGASATLISGSKLNKLKPIQSTELIPNKLYQYFSPIKDHSYVMLVDTSRGKGLDYSAFVIVDISEFPYQVVCVFRDNTISTLVYPEIINRLAIQYNEAFVLIETNDLGQQVADTLRYDLEYENVYMSTQEEIREGGNPKYSPGCRTTKKTKSIGCNMLKDLIENSKLLVNDIEIITELSSFIRVGASYRADDGKHDDLVMCLVMFAYLTTQSVFKNLFDFNLRQQFFAEQLQDLDDQMLPLGFVSRGDDDWLNPTTSTTNGIAYQENKDQWFNF